MAKSIDTLSPTETKMVNFTEFDFVTMLNIRYYDTNKRSDFNIAEDFPETLPAKFIQIAITNWGLNSSMFRLLANPNLTKDQMGGILMATLTAGKWSECEQYISEISPDKIGYLQQIL